MKRAAIISFMSINGKKMTCKSAFHYSALSIAKREEGVMFQYVAFWKLLAEAGYSSLNLLSVAIKPRP